MPVSSVGSAGPIVVQNERSSGASFSRALPGATKAELFNLMRVKIGNLGGRGEIDVTLDEASGTVLGERTKFPAFKLRLIASDGRLEAKVDKYPVIKADLVDSKLRELLDKAPAALEEARASTAWQPK